MMGTILGSDVKKVVVACEAGMGSSVLLVSQLRQRLKDTGVVVEHSPVNRIPPDVDVVVCHRGLEARARSNARTDHHRTRWRCAPLPVSRIDSRA